MVAKESMNRRSFFRHAGIAAFASAGLSRPVSAMPPTLPNPIGYSVISWPEAEFQEAFETISALGYQGVQILGWVQQAYPGDKVRELKDQLRKLKLHAEALSCRGVSLRPDSSATSAGIFRPDIDFFHALDGAVLQITDGGKFNGQYTAGEIKSLGARMNDLGKMAKDSGLTLGYHPHFRTLGETREGLGRVLEATDPRYVGLIADVAHLKLGGSDPAEVIRTYHQRMVMMHLKDLRRDAYEMARSNRAAAQSLPHYFCEIGQGVVDFPAITASMRQSGFRGWAIVELDSYVAPPGGPAASARINKEALQKLGFKIG